MESSPSTSKPHLLLIPYPLQGHIIPAVQLALKLAAAGFSVTFVNTEAVHHHTSLANDKYLTRSSAADGVNQDIFAGARSSGLDIRYEIVGDGLPVTFDRSLNHDEFMLQLLHSFHGNVEALAGRLPPISGLVADTFFVWPATLARSLGIPYISFWTEPALVFSLYYHMDLLRRHGHFGALGILRFFPPFSAGGQRLRRFSECKGLGTIPYALHFIQVLQAKVQDVFSPQARVLRKYMDSANHREDG